MGRACAPRYGLLYGCAPALVAGADGWRAVDLEPEPLGRAHHAHWLDIVRGDAPADDSAAAGLSTLIVAEHIYRASREGRTLAVSSRSRDAGPVTDQSKAT